MDKNSTRPNRPGGCSEVGSAQPVASDETQPVYGLKRPVYWALAVFFFALAMIGVVLPGIPTTPFLLLMCYFLIRVSPSLHAKVLVWPVVGRPLRDWRDQGGVRKSTKLTACMIVTVLVGATLVLGTLAIKSKLAILLVATYGVSVVVRLPTVR